MYNIGSAKPVSTVQKQPNQEDVAKAFEVAKAFADKSWVGMVNPNFASCS